MKLAAVYSSYYYEANEGAVQMPYLRAIMAGKTRVSSSMRVRHLRVGTCAVGIDSTCFMHDDVQCARMRPCV